MPLYEYHCTACQTSTEILQKISDAPATECPHCHQNALEKQISSTSFQLKGGGWYVTDFKNKSTPETKVAETKTTETPKPASTEKKEG